MKKVTVQQVNAKGRREVEIAHFDDMVGVARFLLTYKGKRGYEVVEWKIEDSFKLF